MVGFGYLTSIWQCRYFWLSLVRMDLRTRYRRSILGLGWSLLHPIAMTTIICFVFHRIFKMDLTEYAPSLMAGLAFWNYFQGVTLQGCQSFFQAKSYIRQYPSPLAIYPLRTALGAGVHFAIALSVVLALALYCGSAFHPLALLTLLPTLVLMFLLGWGMALLAGMANVLFQDSEHLATVGFQILFYATPIIYTDQTLRDHGLAWLMRYNPLVAFLKLLRDPILKGQVPSWETYGLATSTVVVVTGTAALLLARLQRRFIFHL